MKATITAIALILTAASDLSSSAYPDLICRVAPEIIKRAHKYHGILVSYEDSKGHFFLRDGVRCKLITNDFLREDNNDF